MADVVEVRLKQAGRTTSEAVIRTHRVLVDRPVAKGGDDRGAMGGELLLTALGGCFMSNLLAAIRTRDAEVSDVRAHVLGTLEGSPGRFSAIELRVSAECSDQDLLRKLVTMAERSCIVTNTLRGAVKLSVAVKPRDKTSEIET